MGNCVSCGKPIEYGQGSSIGLPRNPIPLCRDCDEGHPLPKAESAFARPFGHARPGPDYDPDHLSDLPDRELLQILERAFKKVIYVNHEKKISAVLPRESLEPWLNFGTAWTEALRRGYTEADLASAIKSVAVKTGFWKDLHEKLGMQEALGLPGVAAWKQFEQLVGTLHGTADDDWVVTVDERIPDRTTGTPRQIDVSVRFRKSFYEFLVIIECRDQKANVKIGDVEEFVQKVEDLKAHKGVMVAGAGFDPGAVAKAKFYGIDLFTLSEACSLDWQHFVREVTSEYPFPDQITFVPVEPGDFAAAPTGYAEMSFLDMVLTDSSGQHIETLAGMLAALSARLMRDRVSVPAKVRVSFDTPIILRVDRVGVRAPIIAIDVFFTLARRIQRRTLEKPEVSRRYEYRNIDTGDVHLFPVE